MIGLPQDAVVKGWFRTDRRPSQGEVDIRAVAMTAMEVASAILLLHERNIVHGVSILDLQL